MSDPRKILQSLYEPRNRFQNFGNVLQSVQLRGFRCHTNTLIEFHSPITAFCGLNGTGKSTILQIAATAYRAQDGPYNISDFMVVSALDAQPFTDTAKVEFKLCQETGHDRPLTFSRNTQTKRWQGYGRRVERAVFFAGIGTYLPSCEESSYRQRASGFAVTASEDVKGRIFDWTCRVLGQSYAALTSNQTTLIRRRGNRIISITRDAASYSEAHMGFGEARTIHIIKTLESLPEKSFVLIEEPETSLHLSAQHAFGQYLLDVCIQKRHQVVLTTHSEYLLQALPSASRIHLERGAHGIVPIPGLSALQARSFMTHGHSPALVILVEDATGKAVLAEILRRHDVGFLSTVKICVGGDKDRIRITVEGLKQTGLPVAAVRDADKEGSPRDNIFKLPGSLPPEKEIFASATFREHVLTQYGVRTDDFTVSLQGIDHHDWLNRLAERVHVDENALICEAARAYVRGLPDRDTATLVTLLKAAIS